MSASNVIREGFICAECHATFSGTEELLKHYEKDHQSSSFVKDLIKSAKQKITKDFSQSLGGTNPFLPPGTSTSGPVSAPTYVYEPQKPGVFRGHFEAFRLHRKTKVERYAAEGNKLLIRLHKLCDGLPEDPFKRKAHEQSVVNWIDEKSVTRCPDCTEAFNVILKRKHHCRLCGSVLCEDCSVFLGVEDAKILTKTISSHPNSNSYSVTSKKDDVTFRLCSYCSNILETRKTNYEVTDSGKKLVADHLRLRETIKQAEQLVPELEKVVDSLNAGESLYSTQQANSIRGNILKLTGQVDIISKTIMVSPSENGSDALLRQRIRSSSVISIRNLLVTLPVIPGEEDLAKLKAESVQDIKMKKGRRAEVIKSDGWVGDVRNVRVVDDPIEQQIINLRELIEQAKQAGKLEESVTLAQSLKELLDFKQDNQ